MKKFADLHLHTNFSDGQYRPQQVIQAAYEQGLSTVAITDHDTVDGLQEAREACQALGMEFISGIEISTFGDDQEIHILGYFLEGADERFFNQLAVMQTDRQNRCQKIIKKLNDLGYGISYARVQKLAGAGTIGRPHIAKALLERKYIGTMKEAFTTLIGSGCPAYVPRLKITPLKALEIISSIGAIPVLAHPGINPDDELIPNLVKAGLLGLEVWHPQHNQQETQKYWRLSQQYNLLATGGSDWHGSNKDDDYLGKIKIEYQYVAELKRKAQTYST